MAVDIRYQWESGLMRLNILGTDDVNTSSKEVVCEVAADKTGTVADDYLFAQQLKVSVSHIAITQ
jgi:hypothetical protein